MDVRTHAVMADRLSLNLRAVPGYGDVQLRIESLGHEGDSAFVTICAYDTVVLFDIQDSTNPTDDIIYNDDKESFRVRWELRYHAGRWLLYDNVGIDALNGGDLCGF